MPGLDCLRLAALAKNMCMVIIFNETDVALRDVLITFPHSNAVFVVFRGVSRVRGAS